MAFRKVLKRVAKKAWRATKRAAKKRYVTKTGRGIRVGQVAKDVMMLKKMINAEKKQFIQKITTPITVGQVNGDSSGHQIIDVTPAPAQGTTSVTRNGNSIKLSSSYNELYMVKQGGNAALKLLVEFYRVPGEPYSATEISNGTAIADLFSPNDYITGANIYDMVASRKQDTFRNFRKIYSRVVYFPANNISNVTQVKLVKIPLKWGHHIKFAADGSSAISTGQILMVIRCDSGNRSTSVTNSFTNVAVNGTSTGVSFHYALTNYFIDN